MTSELGYFIRLIEMTSRGSKEGSNTSKDEREEEMGNNSDESQISTHADRTDFQSEIFTDMTNDYVDHHDDNPSESKMSRVVIQDSVLDLTHVSEKKHAKSQPFPSSNATRTQSNKNEYDMEKKYNDNLNAIGSKSAPVLVSENRLESNLSEDMSQTENQVLTTDMDQRLGNPNGENNLQSSSNAESLLHNAVFTNRIRRNIGKMINSKIDQNSVHPNGSTYTNKTRSDGSLRNDNISVSIDTIVIKVSNEDRGSDPTTVQHNFARNEVQHTDRLRRYCLRLR